MKKIIWGGIFLLLGAPSFRPTASAAATGELSPVIGHVLSEGKSNNIPPAFSYALGLSTNKPAAGKGYHLQGRHRNKLILVEPAGLKFRCHDHTKGESVLVLSDGLHRSIATSHSQRCQHLSWRGNESVGGQGTRALRSA